jgi:hypothetical protein
MSADEPTAPGFSLRRWSQRKLDAARAAPAPAEPPVPAGPGAAPPDAAADTGASATQPAAAPSAEASASRPVGAAASDVAPLPPVESLTIDSDFTAFLQPKVDEALRRQALKQLFRDPRFNVMDGLDVYIDDYSKPDPISPEIVRQLVQARYIFDPPATRVNERGEVEDAPPEDAAAAVVPEAAEPPVVAALPPSPEPQDTEVPAEPGQPDTALPAQRDRSDPAPQ